MEKTKSRALTRRAPFVHAFEERQEPKHASMGIDTYVIKDLSFTYPNRDRQALSNINITIEQGEFVTLCGPSGSGKTTLLRHLKLGTTPHGVRSGEILFENESLGKLSERDAASRIGFVLQSPDNQIVTDKVWHELAFGLESLGVKSEEIRLRVAEMASFFGIQSWFHKPVTELSGGQKQLLALASIMALQPSALILDEPTSQLDPIAAGEFLSTVGKINRELGVTVILTEHRLEEVFPLSTRAIVMDKGSIIADGNPRDVGMQLSGQSHGMFLAMPTPMRVWAAVSDSGTKTQCPITVREGSNWLKTIVDVKTETGTQACSSELQNLKSADDIDAAANFARSSSAKSMISAKFSGKEVEQDYAVSIEDVWFKYEKEAPDIIKGLNFTANYGEVTAILGGNGTGKSTTLSLIGRLNRPYRGKISTGTPIYTLPQNPQTLFVEKTVREDLLEILSERKLSKDEKQKRLASMVKLCRLESLLESHPYDLSGGEQQRAALAKVLLLQPKIILLDEPTKGLDAEFKQIFAAILSKLTQAGAAVIMASHDVEFCAEYADRCALFFDGSIVTENSPRAFFSGNSFYTTSGNRMARGILPRAVTAEDLVVALGGKADWKIPSEAIRLWNESTEYVIDDDDDFKLPPPPKAPKLTKLRMFFAVIFSLLTFTGISLAAIYIDGFGAFMSGGNAAVEAASQGAMRYVGIILALGAGAVGITLALTYKRDVTKAKPIKAVKKKLSKRTILSVVIVVLTIPLTIYAGSYFFGDRRYYFVSLLVILQIMLPFALVFEGRKPQPRELVVIAVLCGIAVAGRVAFFMLPQFKPVVALVIIAAIAFGGETGFLVGAMTGFASNFFFGQGPFTPYQMFAFGIIGLLAGVLFQKGLLRRSTGSLAVFGALATFVIYGGILNPASVLLLQNTLTRQTVLLAYLQGLPMDLVHAIATVTFIIILAKPMLEKLDRIKTKYGLVE